MLAAKAVHSEWLERLPDPLVALLETFHDVPNLHDEKQRLLASASAMDAIAYRTQLSDESEPASEDDSVATLKSKVVKLEERVGRDTFDFVFHPGAPFWWRNPWPECPITVEAEQWFHSLILKLARTYEESRPSRKPSALQKVSHTGIAFLGIGFGVFIGTKSRWTDELLSWEEAAGLFDAFCLADCKQHSAEQARKFVERTIAKIKTFVSPDVLGFINETSTERFAPSSRDSRRGSPASQQRHARPPE